MNSNHEKYRYTVWLNNGNETEIVAYPDENGKYVGYVDINICLNISSPCAKPDEIRDKAMRELTVRGYAPELETNILADMDSVDFTEVQTKKGIVIIDVCADQWHPDQPISYSYVVRDEEYCQIDNFFEEGFATVEEALQMAKKALAEEGYIDTAKNGI